MPVLAGSTTRNRKIQVGYQGSNHLSQTVVLTPVVATRVLPFTGVPDVEPNWTHPEVDTGSLFREIAPFRRRGDFTFPMDGALPYNEVPYLFHAVLQGGISPTGGGSAKTWTYQPDRTGSPMGLFTIEFGDGVTTDWYQFAGGIIEELTLTGPQEMGPITARSRWRMADARSDSWTDRAPTLAVPTVGLNVDSAPTWIYLDDCELFIDATSGAIGTTKISDALRSFELTIRNEVDQKSPANGSNYRSLTQFYQRGPQHIEFTATYEKTTQTVQTGSESDFVGRNAASKRFVEMRFTAREEAQGGIPYSLSIRFPLWNIRRTEEAINNNTVVRIRGDGGYDSGLGYPIRAVLVNSLAAL